MNKTLLKFIAIVIGLAFAGTWLHYNLQTRYLTNRLRQANNVILAQDSTITWAANQYERRGQEIGSLREINKALNDSIPELADRLKTLGRRLHSWSQLVAYYEGVLDSGAVVVETPTSGVPQLSMNVVEPWGTATLFTILEDSTLNATTTLDVHYKGIQIQYWLTSVSKEYLLSIKHDPLPIDIIISQDSLGEWVVNAKLPSYIELDRINLTTVPKSGILSLADRITLTAGVTTHPGVLMGVGYNSWSLGVVYTDDAYWMVTRTLPLSWIFGKR